MVDSAEAWFDLLLLVGAESLELWEPGTDPFPLIPDREGLGEVRSPSVHPGRSSHVLRGCSGRETEAGRRAVGPLTIDFGHTGAASRRTVSASRAQPLARAVGLRRGTPTVVDATAGLGRDALMLASLGCSVVAIERSPVLGLMLRAALEQVAVNAERSGLPAPRLGLLVGEAGEVLEQLGEDRPDVVYLDPMYAGRRKSALPKKEMRILRRLVGNDADAADLLAVARRVARRRVVVKRPPRSRPLAAGVSISLTGKLARYDVYLTR
ncbi:MAG: class I SAM-dependent methyltransferase [bacterium]|nr:class I SAM-dependent methyltransferase [bacterium]